MSALNPTQNKTGLERSHAHKRRQPVAETSGTPVDFAITAAHATRRVLCHYRMPSRYLPLPCVRLSVFLSFFPSFFLSSFLSLRLSLSLSSFLSVFLPFLFSPSFSFFPGLRGWGPEQGGSGAPLGRLTRAGAAFFSSPRTCADVKLSFRFS